MNPSKHTKEERARIILAVLKTEIPAASLEYVQGWLLSDDGGPAKERLLEEMFMELIDRPHMPSKRAYELRADIFRRIGIPEIMEVRKRKYMRLSRRTLQIAAVLIPFICIVGYFHMSRYGIGLSHKPSPGAAPVSTVDKEFWHVVSSQDGVMETLLPDGSKVWLNKSSMISYAGNFLTERLVELSGEAYFSVTRSEGAPFTVTTENMRIKVLGTEFSVKAYPEEDSNLIVLHSGSVELAGPGGTTAIAPGSIAILDGLTESLYIASIYDNYVDWRFGDLDFSHENMSTVLDRIASYYRMIIAYPPEVDDAAQISISFKGDEPFSDVISTLMSLVDEFDYRREGRRVEIFPAMTTITANDKHLTKTK